MSGHDSFTTTSNLTARGSADQQQRRRHSAQIATPPERTTLRTTNARYAGTPTRSSSIDAHLDESYPATRTTHDLSSSTSSARRKAPPPLEFTERRSSRALNEDFKEGRPSPKYRQEGETSRQYAAVGLGLPFSATTSSGLSSYAATRPQQELEQQASTSRRPRVPSSTGDASTPSSPMADRSKLIGLGELATPRWTAAIHEQRWGQHPMPHDGAGDWESDVLGSYSNQPRDPGDSPLSSRTAHSQPVRSHRREPSIGSNRSPRLPTSTSMSPNSSAMSAIDQLLSVLSAEEDAAQAGLPSPGGYSIDARSIPDEELPNRSPREARRRSSHTALANTSASSRKTVGLGFDLSTEHEPSSARTRPRTASDTRERRRSSLISAARRTSPPPAASSSPPPPLPSPPSSTHRRTPSSATAASPRHSTHQRAASPSALAHAVLKHGSHGALDALQPEGDDATAEALRRLDGVGSSASPHVSRMWPNPSLSTSQPKKRTSAVGAGSTSSSRRTSQAANAIARPPSSDGQSMKRASSSSTAFSAHNGSRDSTSMTSLSAGAPRSTSSMKALRRTSAGSDVSSVQSVQPVAPEDAVSRGDESPGTREHIPPVPPLPKDWESYRPSTAGTMPMSGRGEELAPPVGRANVSGDNSPSSVGSPYIVGTSTPNLSPALPSSATMPSPSMGQTRTPTKKWSISSALGIARSSSNSSSAMKGSSSYNDFGQNDTPSSTAASKRKSISAHDLAGAAGPPSARRGRASLAPSIDVPRSRTASISSNSTNATAAAPVASSPGKSLLSPRRTPSGIPFFSRKGSGSSSINTVEPTPVEETSFEEKEKDKSGRKSILGITFQRRKSVVPPSPTVPQAARTPPSPAAVKSRPVAAVAKAELERSPSSSSSLLGRKRGKTLPGSSEPPKVASPVLPPSHVNAIPASTTRKIESLSASRSTPVRDTSRIGRGNAAPSPARPSRLAEAQSATAKATLPTIAGSPSVQTTHARLPSEDGKPATPTRIPRAVHNGSTSPAQLERLSPMSYKGPRRPVPVSTSKASSPSLTSTSPETPLSGVPSGSEAEGEKEKRATSATSTGFTRSRSSASTAVAGGMAPPAVPRVLEQSSLPRSVRRTSLIASRSTSSALDEFGVQDQGGLGKSNRAIGLRTPAKTTRAITTTHATPATAPTARRQYTTSTSENTNTRRTSALVTDTLAASKSVTSKLALPARIAKSSTTARLAAASPPSEPESSSQRGTPISEEEIRADEEMSAYVRRQQAKKLAAGASAAELQSIFEFPAASEPLSGLVATEARQLYGRALCEYEREEILEYERVYFFGQNSAKKMASRSASLNNYGYDDERGDYIIVEGDHICFRYEITGMLGKGSFGQVAQCRDHATGENVAIKIIRNKKRFHHQALIEIKVLENLRKWDPDEKHNVVKMTDHFSFRNHLCIVTELLSINLYELVKANGFNGFSTILIRRFTSQILLSLTLLRHHRVVHCDLKPENVLLKHPAKSGVQVIDFGSSCFENEKVYTYIQSRFYRSPEVILGMNYHMAIDMWSLGCILAEMYTGAPLFPGENEQEQLSCIMECLGMPDKYLIDRASRKKLFFDSSGNPRPVVNSKGRRRRPGSKSLAQMLKCDDELFVDFIAKCLVFDPDRRLKAQAALRHPFCKRELRATTGAIASSAIPARAPRLSLNSGSSSINYISTPRRKQATATGTTTATPGTSSVAPAYSAGSSTAPVVRTRQSTAASIPQSVSRYAIRS